MSKDCRKWILFLLVSVAGSPVFAEIYRVPSEYPTIQAGINAAADGDTVLVADGTYTGPGNRGLYFSNKTVTSENGPAACVIDCEHQDLGFVIGSSAGSSTLICGFTVQNGTLPEYYYGSGIECYGGYVRIVNCIVTGCVNPYGYHSGAVCGSEFGYVDLENCLIVNNEDNGIGGVFDGYADISNCTVTGNSGWAIFAYFESDVDCYNSIIWGNSSGILEYYYSSVDLAYCDTQGGTAGTGNISADPLFVNGPLGNHYLSHLDAGQGDNSPCIDAGSDQASTICYEHPDGEWCMSTLTTRTDFVPDSGTVDMGFHYSTSAPPTPPPTETQPPSPSPTPTFTPDPSWTATPTPDPAWTSTPVPTATPTESPAFPDGVELIINDSMFTAGDDFKLRALCRGTVGMEADLYIILDVYGDYWFYPGWTQDVECARITISEDQLNYYFVLDFTWPEGEFGSAYDLKFWGAMLEPDSVDLIGEISSVTFGYE